MKFIVTTTIYKQSEAVKKFKNKAGRTLIVVGDKKTPHHEYINDKDIIYLTPEYQETTWKELSDLVGKPRYLPGFQKLSRM